MVKWVNIWTVDFLSLPQSSNVKGPGRGLKTTEGEGQHKRTRAPT